MNRKVWKIFLSISCTFLVSSDVSHELFFFSSFCTFSLSRVKVYCLVNTNIQSLRHLCFRTSLKCRKPRYDCYLWSSFKTLQVMRHKYQETDVSVSVSLGGSLVSCGATVRGWVTPPWGKKKKSIRLSTRNPTAALYFPSRISTCSSSGYAGP